MKSPTLRLAVIATVFAYGYSTRACAEDLSIDRLLASQCAQCHGTDGYPLGDIDELAGESLGELVEEMLEMQNERRPDDIMEHQARGYTEAQIRRIARYFSALPSPEGSDSDHDDDD